MNIPYVDLSSIDLTGIVDGGEVCLGAEAVVKIENCQQVSAPISFDFEAVEEQVANAIRNSMPRKNGERNERIFHFCRRLQ